MSNGYKTLLPDTDFVDASQPRVVLAVDGLDKAGKDRFAFTAPKPLLLLDFDMGSEGVEGSTHPLIVKSKPFAFRPTEISFETDMKEEDRARLLTDAAWPHHLRFRNTYLDALKKPLIITPDGRKLMAKTIVIDTGSEAWEMMRYAEFGKLTKVMPHHYTAVNSQMRDLVRAALESNVNVIWLHQLKAEWKDNAEGKGRKTGTLERAGFERMANLVQANFLVYRVPRIDDGKTVNWKWGEGNFMYQPTPRALLSDDTLDPSDLGFRMVCGNSRHDPTMEGLELSNDAINFQTIATMMLPESTDGDWADAV